MSQLGLEQKYVSKQLSVKIGDLEGNFEIIDLIEKDSRPENQQKQTERSRKTIAFARSQSRKTIRAAKTPVSGPHVHFSDDIYDLEEGFGPDKTNYKQQESQFITQTYPEEIYEQYAMKQSMLIGTYSK